MRLRIILLFTGIFLASSIWTVACQNSGNGLVDGSTNNSSLYQNITALQLNTTQVNTLFGGTFNFLASGGLAPYKYSITVNQAGGKIDPNTGIYTAGGQAGTDVVMASDSNGSTTTANVIVSATGNGGGGGIIGNSEVAWTRKVTGISQSGVQVACGSGEDPAYVSSSCSNGATPSVGPVPRGFKMGCAGQTSGSAIMTISCTAMRTVGVAYSRAVSATGVSYASVFCDVSPTEIAAANTSECNGVGTSEKAGTRNGSNGFNLTCTSGVQAISGAFCQGTPTN